ncbi:hypothetical protein P7D22_19340 [Lichenihabitans sp. Uapishka_5]|uniref:hypothetical protein n=1 Tax=Lichenihabitans sp. Uapishka_5 TaxID=3037302 RepID=UPI0029E81F48|nr:hypothetical protein [Lichenihabitans sp. Uapishka_5]MDX7953322.1 hypothetical protein [Lichenihabitans sp. Uapishka_5]
MLARNTVLGATLAVALGATGALAQSDSPFSSLAGSWSGNGTISMNDGHNERIRCKAQYEVAPSGIIMHQNLRCASDSYKFEVKSSLQADGSQILGSWTETTRQVTGNVTGTIQGGTIATSVKGTGFTATLGVQTKGNSQSVSIVPTGTDIQSVKIDLKRA